MCDLRLGDLFLDRRCKARRITSYDEQYYYALCTLQVGVINNGALVGFPSGCNVEGELFVRFSLLRSVHARDSSFWLVVASASVTVSETDGFSRLSF